MTSTWPGSPRRKKERIQITKVRNKRRAITNNTPRNKKTIREQPEQLYASKLDNLEEMVKFLEIYSPPKLNREGIIWTDSWLEVKLNLKKTKNKKLPANKSTGPGGFTGKFYTIFNNIQRRTFFKSIFLKLFQKTERRKHS